MENEKKLSKGLNKKILLIIIVVLLVGGLSFYAGMSYGKAQKPSFSKNSNFPGSGNLQGDQNGQMRRLGSNGGPLANGSIISKDDKSITVKLNDGGSKIIFLGDSTIVTKTATGTVADLNVDTNVMVSGSNNSDGSITAKIIQVR
jgi:hypothetical protein